MKRTRLRLLNSKAINHSRTSDITSRFLNKEILAIVNIIQMTCLLASELEFYFQNGQNQENWQAGQIVVEHQRYCRNFRLATYKEKNTRQ